MKFSSLFKTKEAKLLCQWPPSNPPKPKPRPYDAVETLPPLPLKPANYQDASGEIRSLDQTKIAEVRKSERLFFEPVESSSILKESKTCKLIKSPFPGSVPLVMVSNDPYLDFKKSMHEIIESQGIIVWKDWDRLEKLVWWYLRMNANSNHDLIVGAFVDLLVEYSTNETTAYYSTASSSFSSWVMRERELGAISIR